MAPSDYGTDIEFMKAGGRRYALAGSYRNGLQIVDITKPAASKIVSTYDCGVTQGDVQVFKRSDKPGRTFVTYTSDTFGDGTSTCYREAAALGFDVKKDNGSGRNGTFIADLTNPLRPKTVSFVDVPQGSHNQTVHPSGRFLYNSNSDLITSALPAIEVYNITDFQKPKLAKELALPTRPGLGTESHDITFNASGSRAYSAALSQGVIINTTRPGSPSVITSFLDPAINVWHQSDPFTMRANNGTKRDFLIVEDEVAGAVGTGQCPNGGVHVYDITGANEKNPVKVGYWNINEIRTTSSPTNSCTAHVFDIHAQEKIMTIASYNGGVRVVDLRGLMGIALGDTRVDGGMREIGFYRTPDANSWSAKTPFISRSGDFYLYGNDINRGLDIYRFGATLYQDRSVDDACGGGERAHISPAGCLDPGDRLLLSAPRDLGASRGGCRKDAGPAAAGPARALDGDRHGSAELGSAPPPAAGEFIGDRGQCPRAPLARACLLLPL